MIVMTLDSQDGSQRSHGSFLIEVSGDPFQHDQIKQQMNQPPPLPPVIAPEFQRERTSALSAGKFSLWAPVLVIPINLVVAVVLNSAGESGTRLDSLVHSGASALVIIAGFCLGWFALWKTRQVGRERIWGRAVAGIAINGVLLICVVLVALKMAHQLAR